MADVRSPSLFFVAPVSVVTCLSLTMPQGKEFGGKKVNVLHLRMAGLSKPDEDKLDALLWKPVQRQDQVCEVIFRRRRHRGVYRESPSPQGLELL